MNDVKFIELTNNNSLNKELLNKINFQSINATDSDEIRDNKNFFKKYFSKLKKNKFNILSISCFILSVIFYILSCEGCFLGQYECVKELSEGNLNKLVIYVILSSFFYSIYFILCIHKKINKIHLILSLVYIYLFNRYYKANWDDHGFYNRICFILFVLLFLLVFEYINLIIFLKKKKKYKLIIILIIIPFIPIFSIKYYFRNKECKKWEKGLLNTKMESKEKSLELNKCFIISPKKRNRCI